MKSQWDCLLENLGEWQGSFTRFSPQGDLVEDTPTIVSLEGLEDNKLVHQVVRRLPPNQPPQEMVLEYRSLSRSILFFDNGAFSQGSMQWGPFSEFGVEFGLIEGDRRLRIVQMFNKEGNFDFITLIREKLAQSHSPERPPLTVDQLLGEWIGEATIIYPDWRSPDKCSSVLKIDRLDDSHIHQQLSFGSGDRSRTIESQARIEGSRLIFEQSEFPVQVLMLADGGSSNCPLSLQPRHAFVLEVGWLLDSKRRQRLIRSYDEKGGWVSLTLVTEEKIR